MLPHVVIFWAYMEELEKETCKIIAALRQTIFDLESPNQRASFGPQTGSEGAYIASYFQLSYTV